MEDVRPVRSRISAILQDCNFEEHRQVLEFLKKLKPQSSTVTRTGTTRKTTSAKETKQINVEIDYLCGRWMHFCGKVAQWTYDMHFKGKRPESYEKVLTSTKICYAATLPIRLVAVSGQDCIGSISIVKHDYEGKIVPLITFLCVPSEYKNAGVEKKLISQSVRILKGLGHKDAYIKADKQFFPEDMLFEPIKGQQGVFHHRIPPRIIS